MLQPRTPPRAKRFAEPEITSATAVWRSTLAGTGTPLNGRHVYRAHDPRLEAFGIALLAPAFVILTAIILVALLGIFVIWLCIVGLLFAATGAADLAGRWWRRARLFGALDHRALGYPGR
jgi:hypothetical protein